MHLLRTTLWICLLCGVVTPLAAQDDDATNSAQAEDAKQVTEPDVAEHVAVNAVASDLAIETRLTDILNATKWFDQVTVEVRDSVAFIDGTAVDDARKEWAGQLARNTEGVAAVVNQIEVKKIINLSETANVVATSVRTLWEDLLVRSPLLLVGLLVLMFTALVNSLAQTIGKRVAKRSRLRGSLQDLILQLVTIAVWTVGLMLAAVIVFPGMTPAKALTVLGLGSVAIGFAFKDIFENFFAGILILWKYPFDKGDFVECNDVVGRIEDITIRMTMIRQVDGQLAVVPNAMLFKNPVDVLTSRKVRRTTVNCGVAYDADLNEARDVIQKAVESCSTVNTDEPVEIFAREFADSSINFEVTWWTGATPREIRESRDEVVRQVKQRLDDANIEIPFPQRTLWLPEPVRTTSDASKKQAASLG
ncbi:MAG: mechanosensitive ion channel [Planctomycetaceae bacterium]|nr:mechanosensitive ion channel [Planctomycetales bacterium]MCB9940634.1 mechanosensitive ion channel [Planctomycetaceae bacterium]